MQKRQTEAKPETVEEPRDKGLSSSALFGIAAMCATAGVEYIGDTEDIESKEDAFDEWMEGKWKAIRAVELKRGDMMRDSAGDAIKIDGAYLAGGEMVFVQSGSLSMHIPQNGVVLILPNAESIRAETKP